VTFPTESEILVEYSYFSYPLLRNNHFGKNGCEYFHVCSQPRKIPDLTRLRVTIDSAKSTGRAQHHIRGRNATRVLFRASLELIPYELPCEIRYLQKAQLSQRGRAALRVVEKFAKLRLLRIMQN